MAGIIFGAAIALCVGSWLYCVVQFIRLLGRRKPDVSLSSLMTGGMKAFDPQYFTEAGAPIQRGLKRGMVVFFAGILLSFAGVAVGIATQESEKRATVAEETP